MKVPAIDRKTSRAGNAPHAAQDAAKHSAQSASAPREAIIELTDPLPQATSGGLEATTFWAGVGAMLLAVLFTVAVFAPDLQPRPAFPHLGATTDPIVKEAPVVRKQVAEAAAQTQSLTALVRETFSKDTATAPPTPDRPPFIAASEASTPTQQIPAVE